MVGHLVLAVAKSSAGLSQTVERTSKVWYSILHSRRSDFSNQNHSQGRGTIVLNPALAKRYATALADLAAEENLLGAVGDDLARFAEVVKATPGLHSLLTSPTAPVKEKHAALDAYLTHAAPARILGNFLKLLIDKRRMELVDSIMAAYHKEMETRGGRITVELQSAMPLEPHHAVDLQTTLSKLTGKEVRLESRVEPDLLGGIVVRIGSLMMDYSVRNHLNRLKAQMRG
ncbi:MAG: ATP synthase F1 subunit delta [Magnetococcales bacterium]|nr:ATP synthase F1 subunit delta [Magnetococcales bacterium]